MGSPAHGHHEGKEQDPASVAILEHIAQLPRDAWNHPFTPVIIRHIVIQP
jgi:hypothetical protein